jgi:hypothetical protein
MSDSILLKLKMNNGAAFKSFIEGLEDMLGKTRLFFSEQGMFFKAMNETRILYSEANISASSFDEYVCRVEKDGEGNDIPVQLDIDLEDLDKILDSCGDNEAITIEYRSVEVEEDGGTTLVGDNKITIRIKGLETVVPRRKRKFNLALTELPEAYLVQTELDLGEAMIWSIEMPVGLLDTAIKDAERVSGTLRINVSSDEELNLIAESDLSDYVEPIGDAVDIALAEGAEPIEVENEYQISPLKAILKLSQQATGNLQVELGTQGRSQGGSAVPIRIRFPVFGEGVSDNYLAPKADEAYDEGGADELEDVPGEEIEDAVESPA